MIQSASILPITGRFPWGRALPPGPLLTQVNTTAGVDALSYRKRDQELAYRDLIVAALVSQVVINVGDVWQLQAARPQLPATVIGDLANSGADTPSTGARTPGSVPHVNSLSIPLDAVATDRALYARDLVLHEALYRAAAVLVDNPVPELVPTMPAGEAWSIAEGVTRQLASVGFNLPLDVALFKSPDTDLAARDNVLAAYVSQLQQTLSDVFSRATRLLIRAPGTEPEIYALTTATDEVRIWSAYPLLPDGRLQVVYDVRHKTVAWLAEDPVASAAAAQSLVVPVAGGNLSVVAQVPPEADAEFFRQKAARLFTRPYVDRVVFQTTAPELYLTNGGLYQPDAVLLSVPGTAVFSLPLIVPPGCVRIGLHVMPSRVISILGFLNTERSADGTAVTMTEAGVISFVVPLPAGRVALSLDITDKTAKTPAFAMQVTAGSNLIFDGAFTFNTTPGVSVTTQSFEFDSAGGDTTVAVTWLGGAGQLTLNTLTFIAPIDPAAPLSYTVAVQVGAAQATLPVQLNGIPERSDVVWFDTIVPASTASPTLGISWTGGDGCALYVHAYDLRVFDLKAILPNAAAYEPHKAALTGRAVGAVRGAYAAALRAGLTELRTVSPLYDFIWDTAANESWLAAIANYQPRLLSAFHLAGPGDVGRPALIPDGLELTNGVVVATLAAAASYPVLRILQPWMLGFGPRVAGADFWPLADPGCASDGDLGSVTVSADFSWALSAPCVPDAGTPFVSTLVATSHLTGAPDGGAFSAYTIANGGPGGGTLQQTVNLQAGLAGLLPGATYTLTTTISTRLVGGGISTPGAITQSVTATGIEMTVAVPTIVAATGYLITVQSVKLT